MNCELDAMIDSSIDETFKARIKRTLDHIWVEADEFKSTNR